jgi:hypothetical protein
MLYLMYPPRTRALLSVRKTHNGKRSRIHDGEYGGLSRSGTRSERRSRIHECELARGQPGRQLAGSLSPSDGHGGSDPRVRQLPGRAAPPAPPRTRDELAVELRDLWPTCVPGFLKDRRHLGVRDEVLPALRIPVGEHPDPALLIGDREKMCEPSTFSSS